jgi:hypothetical protein
MYRGSRHLGKIIGPYSRPYVPTSVARVRNASVGAGHLVAKVGKPKAGGTISQQAAVHRRPWKTNKETSPPGFINLLNNFRFGRIVYLLKESLQVIEQNVTLLGVRDSDTAGMTGEGDAVETPTNRLFVFRRGWYSARKD